MHESNSKLASSVHQNSKSTSTKLTLDRPEEVSKHSSKTVIDVINCEKAMPMYTKNAAPMFRKQS
jgi:hypothetical protein